MKQIASFILFVIGTFNNYAQNTDFFIDTRDNKTYKIVTIGTQTWLGENLAYLPEICDYKDNCGYSIYEYNEKNYPTIESAKKSDYYKGLGAMYSYAVANEVCPTGWRLPDKNDWDILIDFLGGPTLAASKLMGIVKDNPEDPLDGATSISGFSAKRFSLECSMTVCATFWVLDQTAQNLNLIAVSGYKPIAFITGTRYAAIRCIKDK